MIAFINIYDYFDYRKFLSDYYQKRKAVQLHFSYRAFCQTAGISSSSVYRAISSGARNMTHELLPKFLRGLKLESNESRYFELMVDYTHAKTGQHKQELFERMTQHMPPAIRQLRSHQVDYYRKWYHVAVRESLALIDVADDFQELARFLSPRISISEAKAAIDLISRLGLATRNGGGFWKTTEGAVTTGLEMDAWVIHSFQREMMHRAMESLEAVPRVERHVSTATVSISRSGAERIMSKLKELKDMALSIALSDAQVERVYQLNLQFFPLSRDKAKI